MTTDYRTESASETYSADLDILGEIREYLFETLHTSIFDSTPGASLKNPLLVKRFTGDGRNLRVYINNCQTLSNLKAGYFVGFVGEKKSAIHDDVLTEISRIDSVLTDELPRYPFIAAYCSLELPDHYNWVNLVILKNMESLGQWKDSPFHREAARNLSPSFYENARIHVGALESGLAAPFKLIRTSHYNFNQGETNLQQRVIH